MHVLLLPFLLAAAQALTALRPDAADSAVGTVWTFDNLTWIENLAVRQNGEIICSSLNRAALYLVNPFAHKAFLIHQFEATDGALGIAEVQNDVFVVVTANISTATTTVWPGSAKIWRVNMTAYALVRTLIGMKDLELTQLMQQSEPIVSLIADLEDVGLPDGVVKTTSESGLVLVSDASKGIVWAVDANSGGYNVAIQDSAFNITNTLIPIGVDGVKIANDQLYFTNLASGAVGRVPLTTDSTAAGPISVLANLTDPDDLAVRCDGKLYVVGDNTLWLVDDSGAKVLAGGPNHLTLEGATAAQFGRTAMDSNVLYITTNGGLLAPVDGVITGGKILAVNVETLL